MKKYKTYIIFVAVTLLLGALGGLATYFGMDEYEMVAKPALTPPDAAFPVVWTILFILMGIGGAMVWEIAPRSRRETLLVYGLQLAANILWSVIYFTFQAYLFAFVWLLLLWVLIINMILHFRRFSPTAAYLQIPYLLWVTFAGYLNLMVWLLNR